ERDRRAPTATSRAWRTSCASRRGRSRRERARAGSTRPSRTRRWPASTPSPTHTACRSRRPTAAITATARKTTRKRTTRSMINSLYQRLTARSLELELLLTACLLLVVGLGTLVLKAGGAVRWMDLAIAGAFVGLFLTISLVLALRGWGEDQVLLPLAALLSGVGLVMARRLEPDLVARYG